MITIEETFRGLKYGLWKNTQYFDNCPPTRKLFLRFKNVFLRFYVIFLEIFFGWFRQIMRTVFNLAIIL